jgi:hypothetical protein
VLCNTTAYWGHSYVTKKMKYCGNSPWARVFVPGKAFQPSVM